MVSTNSNVNEDVLETVPRHFSIDIRVFASGSLWLRFADNEFEKAYINDLTTDALQARTSFVRVFLGR